MMSSLVISLNYFLCPKYRERYTKAAIYPRLVFGSIGAPCLLSFDQLRIKSATSSLSSSLGSSIKSHCGPDSKPLQACLILRSREKLLVVNSITGVSLARLLLCRGGGWWLYCKISVV